MDNDNVIELLLTGMNLSLGESENTELKESNNYQISIETKEDLYDCEVLMKKYGQTTITSLTPLVPRIKRMVNFTFDTIDYWGELSYLETKTQVEQTTETLVEKDIYQSSFVTYAPVYSDTNIPNMKKITNYTLENKGNLIGGLKYDRNINLADKYVFDFEKIDFNNFVLTETLLNLIRENLDSTDKGTINIDNFIIGDEINISIDIKNNQFIINKNESFWEGKLKENKNSIVEIFIPNLKVSNNDMDFPDPPLIENKLIIDSSFPISGTLVALIDEPVDSVLNTENDELEGSSSEIEEDINADLGNNENTEDNDGEDDDETGEIISLDDENNGEVETPEEEEEDIENIIPEEEGYPDDSMEEDDEDIEVVVKEKEEQVIEIQKIDIDFSSYDEDDGKYYYRYQGDWSYTPGDETKNLFLLNGEEENEEEREENGVTVKKIVGKINGKEYLEKRFKGTLTVIFNENDFNDYIINLNATVDFITKKSIIPDEEGTEPNSTPVEIEETVADFTFSTIKNYNNMVLDFSEFDFETEVISKENFDNYDLIDTYTIDLSSDELRKEIERLTFGVGRPKKDGKTKVGYDFVTNAIEFEIVPAFLSFTDWSNLKYFVTDANYLIGYFDEIEKQFYKDKDKKVLILGRANVVYIDRGSITDLDDLDKIHCYGWEPINGFSLLVDDSQNININDID